MEKFSVKIDRRTVKRQQCVYQIPGRQLVTSKETKRDGDKWVISTYKGTQLNDKGQLVDGYLVGQETIYTNLPLYQEGVEVTIESPVQNLYSLGAPSYAYSYLPTEVQCNECKKIFPHTELTEENSYDWYDYSCKVCPHCHAWDCCDLEFEKLSNEELEKLIAGPINQVEIC